MTQSNLLEVAKELAKQGDAKAIAGLLSRSLRTKGISVKASQRNGELQLWFRCQSIPPRDSLLHYLQQALTRLEVPTLPIAIYVQPQEADEVAWRQQFTFHGSTARSQAQVQSQVQAQDQLDFTPAPETSPASWLGEQRPVPNLEPLAPESTDPELTPEAEFNLVEEASQLHVTRDAIVSTLSSNLQTDITETDITEADITDTDIAETGITETDITDTDIAETDIAETDIAETDITETDITGVSVIDIRGVVETDSVLDTDFDTDNIFDTGIAQRVETVEIDETGPDEIEANEVEINEVETNEVETDVAALSDLPGDLWETEETLDGRGKRSESDYPVTQVLSPEEALEQSLRFKAAQEVLQRAEEDTSAEAPPEFSLDQDPFPEVPSSPSDSTQTSDLELSEFPQPEPVKPGSGSDFASQSTVPLLPFGIAAALAVLFAIGSAVYNFLLRSPTPNPNPGVGVEQPASPLAPSEAGNGSESGTPETVAGSGATSPGSGVSASNPQGSGTPGSETSPNITSPSTGDSGLPTPAATTSTGSEPGVAPSPPPGTATDNPWRDAVNNALRASTLAQTAQTPEEWQEVATYWEEAIRLMEAVPPDDVNYLQAQDKARQYVPNLEYARRNANLE